MKDSWVTVSGVVVKGHQVASGKGEASPYPQGAIAMQIPFFQQLGLDLKSFFPGTLNVSITPRTFVMQHPEYTFRNVEWTALHPPEHFSFSRCRVCDRDIRYDAFIYYPHPETKRTHFQNNSTLEIIAPAIANLDYGDSIRVEINPQEILVS